MKKLSSVPSVAALSLLFTFLFFAEYIPPFRRVHIPYDLGGFHYPLADYAFQGVAPRPLPHLGPDDLLRASLRSESPGSAVYPPAWLMFAVNLGRARLSFQSLEDLVIAHVWIAFLLCFVWLRSRRLTPLACVFGGMIFSCSGYLMTQLQHLGLVIAYTWMPLGFWGIDEAAERHSWRPLWKLAVASALAFLGGYTPTWAVFAVAMFTYALCRAHGLRVALKATAALAFSLLLAAVQLLPAMQATALKIPEKRYGGGIHKAYFFLTYLVPNAFDFSMKTSPQPGLRNDYFYLGAAAFLGLLCLFARRRFRDLAPYVGVLTVSLIAATNPFGVVWAIVRHSVLLSEICRDWYFLAGVTAAIAPLAAYGIDYAVERRSWSPPRPVIFAVIAAMAAFSIWQLHVWFSGAFVSGWKSGGSTLIVLILLASGFALIAAQKGAVRAGIVAALLLLTAVEYKVDGTSQRFDADSGYAALPYFNTPFPSLDTAVYHEMLANRQYRVVLEPDAPFPTDLRHVSLTTPQGFDPFVTFQFKALMDRLASLDSNRTLEVDPANEPALRILGVRYVMTGWKTPPYQALDRNPDYRLLSSAYGYYHVFEFLKAHPPYGWVSHAGEVTCTRWQAETRQFTVQSTGGGDFYLAEQRFPGWRATVDGAPAPISPWEDAFQKIAVPAGAHVVRFTYRSNALLAGAAISLPSDRPVGLPAASSLRATAPPFHFNLIWSMFESRLGGDTDETWFSIIPRDWDFIVGVWPGALIAAPANADDTSAGLKAFHAGDYDTAYREWKTAAAQGDASAQFNLGMLFWKGVGVRKDSQEAVRLFRLAADQGLAQAEFQLGLMREQGSGLPQDYAEAQRMYQLAASRGDSDAENGLASLYEQGYGVQQDPARAAKWYQLAVQQGVPEANFAWDC